MAWLDFIKTIRQNDDQEKNRGGWWGNTLNTIDNGIDAVGKAVTSDFLGAVDQTRQAGKTWWDSSSGVRDFTGDVLQSVPRGVVNIGLGIHEKSRETERNAMNKRIEEMLQMSEEERNRLADKWDSNDKTKDGRAYLLNQTRKSIGSLSDDALKKKIEENKSAVHETYKPSNPFLKALLGGEDNEVAKSPQATQADAQKWLTDRGVSNGAAAPLAVAGAGISTLLDAPTGAGNLLKGVGKPVLKQLANEGSEDAVRSVLKAELPKVGDDIINSIAPTIAKATDTKEVANILATAGKNMVQPLADPLAAAKGSANEMANAVKSVANKTTGLVKRITGNADNAAESLPTIPIKEPTPKGYGEASDELLSRFKSTSQNKDPNRFDVKTQLWDKFSPVNDMVRTIEKSTGTKIAVEDDPYALQRLYQGMPDAVKLEFKSVNDVLAQAPDLNSVRLIGTARQIIERAKRGITSTVTPEHAAKVIEEQRAKLGDVEFDKAASIIDSVQEHNKKLLTMLNQEGIVSDEAMQAIQEMGGDYFSKMNVLQKVLSNDNNRALFASGGSFNTTKQSINKVLAKASGHAEGTELLDPLESLYRGTENTMNLIAKNQVWRAYKRLSEKAPELIQNIREPEDVIARMGLAADNAELRPIRNKLDRMIKTRSRSVRRLESAINQLEKKGLSLSLKSGGERMTDTKFAVNGVVTESKLGSRDTGSFVRQLIEKGSRSDIDKIKKMVGNRDAKLTALLDDIGEMKSQYDDVASTVRGNVEKMRGELADKVAADGFELISGYEKGVQGKLAVPKEIAEIFTGKTKAQQDYMTGLMGRINGFVKQNFTSNNPGFAFVTNPIRDFKSFAYNAKDVKGNPLSIGSAWLKGFAGALKGAKDEHYERYIAAGGRSGFYSNENTAQDFVRELQRSRARRSIKTLGVKVAEVHNAKDFMREVGHVITAPLRVMQGAASRLEDAPRLAQFKASVKAGKSDAEAAFNARNVTVDFQQSGRTGQVINAWVPFLNARTQGTIKNAQAIKRSPARAISVYAGLTAAPIALAALNNKQYPEVMKMISDQDRDNNFVIVLGDHKDESGEYDQVIKIPKGDVDKIIGNPLENFMRFLADDDPDSLGEMVTNMIGSALPVDTVKDDQFNGSRAIGSVLPPLLKAPLEAATNRNLYFDSDVVPQRMQDLPANEQIRADDPNTDKKEASTSKVAEFLAPLLGGGSPIKAENTIRNFTGSLLTEAPQDQLGGRLSGASASKMNNEFYKILDKTSKNKNSANNHINQAIAAGNYAEAQQTAQAYNAYLREQFAPFGKTYGSQMTQELADLYDEQKIVLTSRSIKQRQRNQLERQAAQ